MNKYLNIFVLLLYGFRCINASEYETFGKDESYKKYFQQQEEIYQELLKLRIHGARPLNIDQNLAKEVLETCPKEIHETISGIKQNIFFDNEKSIILHGTPGTGKSSLAQAIAIQCQVPCLFFDAGNISTEQMNSGIQNLNKIFEHAKKLEKKFNKPCIVIFDELEALTNKHITLNTPENNILISFWQQLDKLSNSRMIVISTMHKTENLPDQITTRTSMIKIPLPTREQRETILSYYLKMQQDKYQLIYPESITPAYLARKTRGFSHRDLENVVKRATRSAMLAPPILDKNNKFTAGTWYHAFKTNFHNPKLIIPAFAVASILAVTHNTILNRKKSTANQEKKDYQSKKDNGLS